MPLFEQIYINFTAMWSVNLSSCFQWTKHALCSRNIAWQIPWKHMAFTGCISRV